MPRHLAGGQNLFQLSEYIDQQKSKYRAVRNFISICELIGIENCEN